MKPKELFTAVLDAASGEDTVLVTIIAEAGSSPRSAGAHMLTGRGGRICGTIGGGALEYRALETAREHLTLKTSGHKTYHLHPNNEEDLGMLCGGDLEVFFQFIPGGDPQIICLMRDLLRRLEQDADTWIFMDLGSPAVWTPYTPGTALTGIELSPDQVRSLARSKPVLLQSGERRLYSEPVNTAGKVLIFGGGHVAQALEPLLSALSFRCVIFDNREAFVQPALFPTAHRLIQGDYHHIFRHVDIRPPDYVIIATHAFDIPVLRQAVQKDCAYLGIIGSKAKAAAVKQQLRAEGVGEEKIAALSAPIGLNIRSETPEEIAVSIAGELILRRAERRDSPVQQFNV